MTWWEMEFYLPGSHEYVIATTINDFFRTRPDGTYELVGPAATDLSFLVEAIERALSELRTRPSNGQIHFDGQVHPSDHEGPDEPQESDEV
ncbi:hypothetical protein [Actinomycetospora sp. CA-053990]|uniref:hypothetical protein n=1 Tax=Actinomycetospora sp. CA-053990 TaxID=3239891 RepID=UPI003D89E257